MPRRLAARHGGRQEALRRHRAAALIALTLAVALPVGAATAKPKPPKPPKPKLELLTTSERGVLRRGEIKIAVEAKRAKKVTVSAVFTVDGYPDDFVFNLGPERDDIRDGDTRIAFRLSPRQKEVLDFAIKSCRGATVDTTAKTEERSASLQSSLRMPRDCARAR